jgi:hypothetical protein
MRFLLAIVAGSALLAGPLLSQGQPAAWAAKDEKKAPATKKQKRQATSGADHARSKNPDAELTRREAQREMPKPGQANDHSTTARDPQNSSGRR